MSYENINYLMAALCAVIAFFIIWLSLYVTLRKFFREIDQLDYVNHCVQGRDLVGSRWDKTPRRKPEIHPIDKKLRF